MFAQNLPSVTTPFVGRTEELTGITALLANPNCRLLTLVGPGGIGKTRLAVEAAWRLDTPDNVYFVPLQPLTSPDYMVSAIADAIGFQFYPGGDPKQQLLAYLSEKVWVLVLDNLEHLLDGVTLLAEILGAAPTVRILATSRERLNLREEWVLEVGGLNYPTHDAEMDIESYRAVELFAQHARRAKSSFGLSGAQRTAVVRICRLVEGMPLAIELAANWVRVLPCDAIADEIERSLDILETPARNVEPRHRTMRAALDPTWQRLTQQERGVFMKLSVFRGGFTREAAEDVAGASLRTLSALVDKSLLRVVANGRYEVHELLRQYAADKLSETPTEYTLAQDRHGAYYADYMHQRSDDLHREKLAATAREIQQELDNIRTAWEHIIACGNRREIDLFLPGQLWFYWMSGHLYEGETACETAIAALETGSIEESTRLTVGRLYAQAGCFSVLLGRFEKGRDWLHTSLAILRPLAAQQEIAVALIYLGSTCGYLGAYADGQAAVQESMAISSALSDDLHLAWAMGNAAYLNHFTGHLDKARRQLQTCVSILKDLGELPLYALFVLGYGALLQAIGDYHEALRLHRSGLEVATELDQPLLICRALCYLADVLNALEDATQSLSCSHRALVLARKFGDLPQIMKSLFFITEALLKQGRKDRSVERLTLIAHHPSATQEFRDRAQTLLDHLATELPPEAFEAAQERGKAAKLEPTLDALYDEPSFALLRAADARPGQSTVNRFAGIASLRDPDDLSERELEVLHLIADGLTNHEIADQLVIGVSTVKKHIQHIYAKLNAKSRTGAAIRARELNLFP